ncbi:MAG: hypothetical protein HFJ48_08080 [Clostridia bacterium]|nr:hypothetical protein [Clostridia bacterium]
MDKKFIIVIILTTILMTSFGSTNGCTNYLYNYATESLKMEKEVQTVTCEAIEDSRKYYYNQLSAEEQKVYDKFCSSEQEIIQLNTICIGTLEAPYDEATEEDVINELFERAGNIFRNAKWAYRLDNPLSTLWLNSSTAYTDTKKSDGKIIVSIMLAPGDEGYYDFDSQEDLQNATQEVEQKTKEFVDQLSGTTEEKLLKIHDWLLQDAKYDDSLEQSNISDIYGCIIKKEAICGGFAYSFKYVADMAGIDVITVIGYSGDPMNNQSHAWNMCYIDGNWYVIDVTNDLARKNNPFFKVALEEYTFYPVTLFALPT